MSQKNPPGRRHPSFSSTRKSGPTGIPGLKWFLLTLVMAVAVIGYERMERQAPQPPALPQEEAGAPPETPRGKPAAAPPAYAAMGTAPSAEPQPAEEAPPPAEAVATYEMEKGPKGFTGQGVVNGNIVTLVADLGASHVVVPEDLADRLGLKKGQPVPFKAIGRTVTRYAATVDKLVLGRIEIRNVSALIDPDMQTDSVLIGMNVMGLLDMQVEESKLVLRPKQAKSAPAAAPEPVEESDDAFKGSSKECAGQGNKFDQRSLNCLRRGRR